jgi:hypothetical protein
MLLGGVVSCDSCSAASSLWSADTPPTAHKCCRIPKRQTPAGTLSSFFGLDHAQLTSSGA